VYSFFQLIVTPIFAGPLLIRKYISAYKDHVNDFLLDVVSKQDLELASMRITEPILCLKMKHLEELAP